MHIRCIYLWSTPLDPDACIYDSHALDEDECMYTCMMHKFIMRTNQQADSWSMCVWCLYLWSMILDLDMCVWCAHMSERCAHMMCVWCVWYTYLWSWSLILVHACMMRVSKVIDPDTCVYHAGMYDEFWSLILGPYACVMHECIIYVSMMRQILFRTNQRTRRF